MFYKLFFLNVISQLLLSTKDLVGNNSSFFQKNFKIFFHCLICVFFPAGSKI